MLLRSQDWRDDVSPDSELGRLLQRRDSIQDGLRRVESQLNRLTVDIEAAQRTIRLATAEWIMDDAHAIQYLIAQSRIPLIEKARLPIIAEVGDYDSGIRHVNQEISDLLTRYRDLEDALAGRRRVYRGGSSFSLDRDEIQREMQRIIGRVPGEDAHEQATNVGPGNSPA